MSFEADPMKVVEKQIDRGGPIEFPPASVTVVELD